jgi:hypothetical protein
MKKNLQVIALYILFSCFIPILFSNANGAENKTVSDFGIESTTSIARLKEACAPWSTLECKMKEVLLMLPV